MQSDSTDPKPRSAPPLPKRKTAMPQTLAPISRTSVRTVLRALIVDDDKLMLAVLSDQLEDLGIKSVSTAQSGSDALASLARMTPPPEVVMCDLNMPGGDGFQFMEQLGTRQYKGGVILVSGMDDRTLNSASLMARFHRLNILAALHKPVQAAELSAALAKLG